MSKLEAYGHADPGTVLGVIEEIGRFMADVVGPVNRSGDAVGSTFDGDGKVTTPPARPSRTGAQVLRLAG